MKLASITLPCTCVGHASIVDTLLEWCRGYTRVLVEGAWIGADGRCVTESSYRYEFTSPDTKTARKELRALAYRIKTLSDEEAIFIIHANGNTEIV